MNIFKQKRINTGLSRKDVANYLGISWYYIRNIENGQSIPRYPIIIKMSNLYKCTVDELLKVS